MKKFLNTIKENKISVISMSISLFIIAAMVGNIANSTYAVSTNTYSIVFHYAEEAKGVLKTCRTDSSGKINSACADFAHSICQVWTTVPLVGGTQSGTEYTTSQLKSTTFTENKTYYCKSGHSTGKYPGCYTCMADRSIYKWKINGLGDSDCTDGYQYDYYKTTETDCSYCYQCSADSTVFKWSSDGYADAACPGGYSQTTKSQAQCKYVAPTPTPTSACYQCKTDETIMEWRTSETADSKCSGGYTKTEKTEAQCKYEAPTPTPTNACYECKADKNIMKWTNSATGDNACPGGYTKTTKALSQCKTIIPENPKTGNSLIFLVWILAGSAIGCSLWYLKNSTL